MLRAAVLALSAALLCSPISPPLVEARAEHVRTDPLAFVFRVAERIVHGDRHEGLSRSELRSILARGDDLSLTCGSAVDFIQKKLLQYGVRSRGVQLTSPPPHNGFDDGHILLEVETRHGDVLVDVTYNRLFLIDGRPASEADIRERGFHQVKLSSPFAEPRIDPAFPYADYVEAVMDSPYQWYERMFAG